MIRIAAILLVLVLLGGCSTVHRDAGYFDEPDPHVNRGYHDPFGWVGKFAGVTLPLAFLVDVVFVVPIAAILDRQLCEWFPITKAVFRVMAWQEAVLWIEDHHDDEDLPIVEAE